MRIQSSHFILYVTDQKQSADFYAKVLGIEPSLNVPGMTEFRIGEKAVLGLMPEKGIKKLLGEKIEDPALAKKIPRSELYLFVDNPETFHNRAIAVGAVELSPCQPRDWGDRAAYSSDPDGHILAFAKKI